MPGAEQGEWGLVVLRALTLKQWQAMKAAVDCGEAGGKAAMVNRSGRVVGRLAAMRSMLVKVPGEACCVVVMTGMMLFATMIAAVCNAGGGAVRL